MNEVVAFQNFCGGEIVFGRYRVRRCLGRGSIGAVYECEVLRKPGSKIALKILNAKAARDERIIAAFRNEIHFSYRVSHSNVVRCREFFNDGEMHAISMEYVDGMDLWKMIQKNGIPNATFAIDIMKQLCRGVSAIHQAGLIHQDLKPQNVMISRNCTIKITDFTAAQSGFAKNVYAQTGVFGTMEFLSPETILYGLVDQRSDIYAIGILSYLLVTGQLPFNCSDLMSQFSNKIYGKVVSPEHLNRECPYSLSRIILKALRREPHKRYQTMDEMHEDLVNIDFSERPGFMQSILNRAGIGLHH